VSISNSKTTIEEALTREHYKRDNIKTGPKQSMSGIFTEAVHSTNTKKLRAALALSCKFT